MDLAKIKEFLKNKYVVVAMIAILVIAVALLFFSNQNTEAHVDEEHTEKSQPTNSKVTEVNLDLDKPGDGNYEIINTDAEKKKSSNSFLKKHEDYALAPLPKKEDLKVLRAPAVGVVLLNFGVNFDNAKKILDSDLLHKNYSLAINPYAVDIERLNIAKYDKVISIPFEPFSYPQSDPGEGVILTGMSKAEIEKRLDRFFSKVQGLSGFIPIMGEKFFYSEDDVDNLFNIIKKLGIIFINPSPNIKSIANMKASKIGINTINIDFNLIKRAIFKSVDNVLKDAEEVARKTGFVIIAVDANNLNHVKAVSKWLDNLRKEGFRTISPIKLCLMYKYKLIDGPYILKNFYSIAK